MAKRHSISTRTRFEIFKRDGFQCRYCGKRSPEVILEVDHVVPVADDGGSDEMNLVTACWACNRGKAAVPLDSVMTGSDPHDRAIEIAERERQLREYNAVLAEARQRRDDDFHELKDWWLTKTGREYLNARDVGWLRAELTRTAREEIWLALEIAEANGYTKNLAYAAAVVRNRREEAEIQAAVNGAPEPNEEVA